MSQIGKLLPILWVILQSGGSTAVSFIPDVVNGINGVISGTHGCSLVAHDPAFVESCLSKCHIYFYDSSGEEVISTPLDDMSNIINHSKFNQDYITIIYVHGWNERYTGNNTQAIIKGYCTSGRYNIVVIDWNSVTRLPYWDSVSMVEHVCKKVLRALTSIRGAIITVGFSLGAHLAACISRGLKTGIKLIGLDPAGPLCFGFPQCLQHISAKDGPCVVIIHTSNVLGTSELCGHNDVIVNGGRKQENCDNYICWHIRAVYIWVSCLLNSSLCLAVQCDSQESFCSGKCEGNPVMKIGDVGCKTPSGPYYITTTGYPPYCKGTDGLTCKKSSTEVRDSESHLGLWADDF